MLKKKTNKYNLSSCKPNRSGIPIKNIPSPIVINNPCYCIK